MKEVNAEGVKFFYDKDFAYNELRTSNDIIMETDALQFVSKEDLVRICRPVITRSLRNRPYIQYLFWYQQIELAEVDRKVDSGLYTDADFRYSVTTYFVEKLLCFQCEHHYKGLVANTEVFYFMNRPLAKKKEGELREMGKFLNCPNCGTPFRIPAVHLF